jgi:hypothetical protein
MSLRDIASKLARIVMENERVKADAKSRPGL